MDPVSQGALGAAVTLSVFGGSKKLPPRVVGWLGALAGMAPDLDVLIRSSEDSLMAIKYHRHFTHSLAFVPVGAAIALLPWLLRKDVRSNFGLAYAVSFLGYLTHAPLDCTTTYGTLYFWPFSDHRVSLSYVSVVDPVYTLPLLALTVAAGLLARPLLARVGLGYSLLFLALGAVQNNRASDLQGKLAASRGHKISRADVFTTFMNQVTWRSLYESEGKIYVDRIRVPYFGAACVTPGSSVEPLPPPGASVGWKARRGQRLLTWFSSGWVGRDPENPQLMGDLRYSATPEGTRPFWGVIVDPENDKATWVNTHLERETNVQSLVDLIFRVPDGSFCGDDFPSAG